MNAHYLHMKFKYMLLAMLIVGSLSSCNDETLVSPYDEVEAGISVDVKLNFSAPQHDKVVSSRVADYAVSNLYVIACNASGSVVFSDYYNTSALTNGTTGSQPDTAGENNWVMATIPTGEVSIYAFANVEDDIYPGLKKKLDAIVTTDGNAKELIENLTIDVARSTASLGRPGNTWVMSGTCNTTVTTSTTEIKIIKLQRLDSIITFNIKEGGKCTSFKARRWYVMNAPASTYVLEHEADQSDPYDNWDASNETSGFYHSFDKEEQNLAEISANTFTFYMPENRKIGSVNSDDYQLREKQGETKPTGDFINGVYVNGNTVADREFIYAPEHATYVVIMGTYEGWADSDTYGKDKTVSANVVYKIHLGYVNGVANDFFSERNTKYTYNVTVNGVDNIVVEVESEEDRTENNPGATGEVIFTEGDNIYTLDAHYENVLLKFNKDELYGSSQDAFRCIVKTPFTSLSTIDNCDKDWVKVRRNNNASTDLQEYPGDNSSELQSVDEMLDDLYKASHNVKGAPDIFDRNGNVTYTCYVNEFYYDEKPVGVPYLAEEETALWKHFVNKPNRLMYIVCNTKYSADEESSIVSAKYILSQRSIQTIYTTDTGNDLTYAYGIETINESGQLDAGSPGSYPEDNMYGWNNTWSMVKGKNWNIINHAKNGYISMKQNATAKVNGMEDSYNKAYIACMQRNRKSSTNSSSIEKKDLKWYLPALQQYQDIYIGESGINEEAKLYNYNATKEYPVTFNYTSDGNGGYKHYQSSTYSNWSPQIMWSEEGTSSSTLAQREGWNTASKGTKLHIRCARNLGTVSEKYTSFKKEDSNIITVPYLNNNTNSRRGTIREELGEHYNDQDNNKLSVTGAFEIYTGEAPKSDIGNVTGGNITVTITYTYRYKKNRYSKWQWITTAIHPEFLNYYAYSDLSEYKTSQPGCESITVEEGERKWRAPNLREFTLMAQLGKLSNGDVSRTKYYYSHRKGWMYTGYVTMGNNSYTEGSQIRCIRDYESK